MDVAALARGGLRRRLVELLDQRARQRQPRRVGGAQDDGVAARLGQHGGGVAALAAAAGRAHGGHGLGGRGRRRQRRGGAAGLQQPGHQRRQVGGHGVLEGHHLHPGGVGHVQRGDDAPDALQVVPVVGDDQRVGAGVDVDGVVGADQRAQHRHQVVGVLVRQAKDLRLDLPAAPDGAGRHAAGLQLGLGLGQHQRQAVLLDQRKALDAQLRREQRQRLRGRHRHRAAERDGALDARIDHHVAPAERGHGARHGVDLGVDEVQRHPAALGLLGSCARAGGMGAGGQRQQQAGQQGAQQGTGGKAGHGRSGWVSSRHCSKWGQDGQRRVN